MPSPIIPIGVLENCFKDPINRPIMSLQNPSYNCVKNIRQKISDSIDEILLSDKFTRFKKL